MNSRPSDSSQAITSYKKLKNQLLGTSHHFHMEDAEKYGINQAIFLYRVKYLLDVAQKNELKDFYKEGKYWALTSDEKIEECFPWASNSTWKRIISELIEKGVIEVKQFGSIDGNKFNRVRWITLTDQNYYDPIDEVKMNSSEDVKMSSSEEANLASSSLLNSSRNISENISTTPTSKPNREEEAKPPHHFFWEKWCALGLNEKTREPTGRDLENFQYLIDGFTPIEILDAFKGYSESLNHNYEFWTFITYIEKGYPSVMKYFKMKPVNQKSTKDKNYNTTNKKELARPYHKVEENPDLSLISPRDEQVKQFREFVTSDHWNQLKQMLRY